MGGGGSHNGNRTLKGKRYFSRMRIMTPFESYYRIGHKYKFTDNIPPLRGEYFHIITTHQLSAIPPEEMVNKQIKY